MQYVSRNFATKKALKDAVKEGQSINLICIEAQEACPSDGKVSVGGPWYPQPHRWYARVTVVDGIITKVE